jgi:hypothetical protein
MYPVPAVTGVKVLIKGCGTYVNPPPITVPIGVVIEMLPVAPVPTIAVITVGDTTVKEAAGTAPKLTAVAPENPDPIMVTVESVPVAAGENE